MEKVAIEFSPQQIATLNNALIERPYKEAAPLIAHINAEIQRNFDAAKDEQYPSGGTIDAPMENIGD